MISDVTSSPPVHTPQPVANDHPAQLEKGIEVHGYLSDDSVPPLPPPMPLLTGGGSDMDLVTSSDSDSSSDSD